MKVINLIIVSNWPYRAEDIYYSNKAKIDMLQFDESELSRRTHASTTESLAFFSAKVKQIAKSIGHKKHSNPSTCANLVCERVYSHISLYCPSCNLRFCIYCKEAEVNHIHHNLIINLINGCLDIACICFVIKFTIQMESKETSP